MQEVLVKFPVEICIKGCYISPCKKQDIIARGCVIRKPRVYVSRRRKIMKKFLALVLSSIMMVSLAACGDTSGGNGDGLGRAERRLAQNDQREEQRNHAKRKPFPARETPP